jgi:hypothetical protein
MTPRCQPSQPEHPTEFYALDLEGVQLLKGGSGELDKKTDPMLSHISDGLGYMVAREFPIAQFGGGMVRWTI